MHHKAHVGLVDAHPERHRRDHDLKVVALEFLLHVGADMVLQSGVICGGAKAAVLQTRGGVFHLRTAVAVDDAGLAALLLHIAQELIQRLELFHQHVADVWTVEAADLNVGVVQPEQTNDIQACSVIRRGGKRHKRQLGEALTQLAEGGVFRAEIVSPLGDTVRFIHRQQHRVPVREMVEEVIQHQTFRRDIQQANLSGAATRHHLLLLLAGLRGVKTGGRHPIGEQLVDLVFHQRNEGGYHDRQAVQHQRRHLIAEGFPAAGRHHHQAIAAFQHGFNDGFLAGAELLVAKGFMQNLFSQRFLIQYFRLRHVNPICQK